MDLCSSPQRLAPTSSQWRTRAFAPIAGGHPERWAKARPGDAILSVIRRSTCPATAPDPGRRISNGDGDTTAR
jgi:hypothetical protein